MRFLLQTIIVIFIISTLGISAHIFVAENVGGGIIAYTSTDTRVNKNDVMMIDITTGISITLLQNIGEGNVTGRTPLWSPDGQSIAFWTFHNREDTFAYELSLETYEFRNLTSNGTILVCPFTAQMISVYLPPSQLLMMSRCLL